MSLHFGICWIEDQMNEAEVAKVESAVREMGFEPLIEKVDTRDKITEFANRQANHQHFDLILLDLNLGKGLHGDQLAPEVRSAFQSTPILFYSALDEAVLRGKMAEQQVEGVYCVHRDRLAARVGELVRHMTPALNRLSTMRGLAARVVAECDQDFRAILLVLGEKNEEDAKLIVDSLKQRAREASEKTMKELESISDLGDLLESHFVHSAQLFNEVREKANEVGSDEVRTVSRKLKQNFLTQVIHRRNSLAHALEVSTDKGWEIERKGKDPVTVEDFVRFRADFIEQRNLVKTLRSLMIG